MSGDYSKQRFDPLRDLSRVWKQQGRVDLDADWNELVDITERRLRVDTLDTIGRATVPRETPDGFQIAVAGGNVTIGAGRIYVDGILAENHGRAPRKVWDPVLAEEHSNQPVPFAEQPYFPNVNAVAPFPTAGGPHLVYLDVWQREVTYVEEPDLVEKAIGVDTTTRGQNVWQVKALADVGAGFTCDTPSAKWDDLVRPSAGRLSTAAVGVPDDDDDCLVPATGGYKGLENHLYRVEIHAGGPHAGASFKWSRDNASVATSVTAIPALNTLTVARTKWDKFRGFNVGDWIEITDDWRELSGQPGIMRRVTNVVDETNTLTLNAALPNATDFPTDPQHLTDATRHTRIKRWDQKGQVHDTNGALLVDLDAAGSTGVIPVPADGVSIVLEDGVQITFDTDPNGGSYHIADYWVFAARFADASVEVLDLAPPRGIHHHYARLAVVTLPSDVTDCRTLWPPEDEHGGCECTVCLTPESGDDALQKAIDDVKTDGGTICLGVGVYNIKRPLRVTQARALKIRGQGWRTILVYLGEGPAFGIDNSIGVTIEEMTIVTSGAHLPGSAGVAMHNSLAVSVQRCALLQRGSSDAPSPAIAMAGIIVGAFLRENLIVASVGIGNLIAPPLPAQQIAGAVALTRRAAALQQRPAPRPLLAFDLQIDDNMLLCRVRGVSLDDSVVHAGQGRINGNSFLQSGILDQAMVAAGYGIEIRGNDIHSSDDAILISADGAEIVANQISGTSQSSNGIVLAAGDTNSDIVPAIDRCRIDGNRIVDVDGTGILIRAKLQSVTISQNFIERVGVNGILMDPKLGSATNLMVEGNQVLNAGLREVRAEDIVGIGVASAEHGSVTGNTVIGVGLNAALSSSRVGIRLVGPSGSVRVAGNEVSDIGPPRDFANYCAGIESWGPFQTLDIADNRVRRAADVVSDNGTWHALLLGEGADFKSAAPAGAATGATTTPAATTAPSVTPGALLAVPALRNVAISRQFLLSSNSVFTLAGIRVGKLPRGRGALTVLGNLLSSYGPAETVELSTDGSCVFTSNQCALATNAKIPVAHIAAGATIAGNNYVQGASGQPAMLLDLPQPPVFTVLGNIASGPILINNTALAAPMSAMNAIAP